MTKTEETEILYQVSSLLLQAQEDEQVFVEITCRLCANLGASCCSLWLARSYGGRRQERLATHQVVKDLPSELVNLDFAVAKQAIEQEQSLVWQKLRVGENQEYSDIPWPDQAILVQLKLNTETSVTKVSSGHFRRKRLAFNERYRAEGWSLPPSPLSVSIGKGGSAILILSREAIL